jgi:hypothetical protein
VANESWVGFARSPKPDKNLVKAEFTKALTSEKSLVDLFALVTSSAGLSSWLQPTSKTDVKTAGKIHFTDETLGLALFSSVDLGKRVIINSETFGEIVATFKQVNASSELGISFTKMVETDAKADFLNLVEIATGQLEAKLGE